MSLIKEVKEFFESYKVMNTIFDKEGIKVEIFESIKKSLLQVKIIENPVSGPMRVRSQKNMFCDIKVENNIIKMNFKYKETKLKQDFIDTVNSIKRNDYVIKVIGNMVTITVIDPRVEEISKIFMLLEPHCKKFETD